MFTPVPGAVVGGKYRLERPLAQGGMGAIWVAWQTGLDRRVAIKFMARELSSSPVARARFDREAKAAAQLRTPHVVHVHDHGIEGDTPFIAMELLEGEDLNARLRRVKRLPLADAARVAFQVAKALRRAQEAGLVHRDLKPANIFLAHDDGDEIVKILDFGVARLTDQSGSPDGGESTRSGAVVGSPHYMSPEQARGLHPVDHRSDLWALGVILYRAVTGALPFPGTELGDIIIRVWNDPHPTPSEIAPDLPRSLDAFFARALAKSAADRFQSAPELAAAFAEAAGIAVPSISSPFDPRGSLSSSPLVGSPSSPGGASLTPLSSPGAPRPIADSSPSAPRPASLDSPAATFPTPVSWPGSLGPQAAQQGPSPAAPQRSDSPGGTLGGSHELGPRPASHLPSVAKIVAVFALLGLGAGALVLWLRSSPPVPAPAAAGSMPVSDAPAGNAPVSNVPVGSTGVGSTGVGSTGVGSTGVGEPPAGTGAPSQSAPAPGESPSSSAVASATGTASSTASASAKPARGPGRSGHDFGY